MRSNTIIFMIILVVLALAAVIVFPISADSGGLLFDRPIRLGLDLKGGVHLVYQADLSDIEESEREAALDADITAITQRVDVFGVTNPVIQKQGADRILVELPGIADVDKAKAVIGQTAILEFGELAADENDPNIKWRNELGNWKPSTATLNGEQVTLTSSYFKQNTYVSTDSNGRLVLLFEWNSDGSVLSKEITTRLYNNNNARLGIFSGDSALLGDDERPIAPSVNGIITDRGEIEGLSQQEATQLSKLLNAGRIPVPLTPIYEQTVSPLAGANFVDLAFKAAILALILIIIFMSLYYRLPGVLASIALIIYALVNLAIYKMVPVTLTLAGIGGFVASMGMAVDANVLIFERMKEELRAGRTVGAAIEAGFKRAWGAIWDCNITTFIACIIMYWMGSSVVASSLVTGFALTLFIGVLVSMITAITVTRTFLRLFIGTQMAQKTVLFKTIGGR
ncbi:MAG: protein translocase subunit SecD [Dehalococcoidales bacterium]|nr:protein translocase subunit SecD [Dehalococcoidales bacterium]